MASARTTPLGGNLTFVERLLNISGIDGYPISAGAWDISRLVMAPELRGGQAVTLCLKLSTLWLHRNTQVRELCAACVPLLSRFYRRYSFHPLGRKLALEREGLSREYVLIHAEVASILAAFDRMEQKTTTSPVGVNHPVREDRVSHDNLV